MVISRFIEFNLAYHFEKQLPYYVSINKVNSEGTVKKQVLHEAEEYFKKLDLTSAYQKAFQVEE